MKQFLHGILTEYYIIINIALTLGTVIGLVGVIILIS